MTLAGDVNLTELIMSKDDLSGADIKVRLLCFVMLPKEKLTVKGI
jgi:ATP-dependent 26S proteasome regulatory subunit